MTILSEADAVINGERQDQYGNPEDSFELIAQYWTVYLNKKTSHGLDDILDGKDVAIMLTLMKIARMSGQKYKRDNVVDAIGYLAILADRLMADVTESKEEPI